MTSFSKVHGAGGTDLWSKLPIPSRRSTRMLAG
jgi:hypothetical protein